MRIYGTINKVDTKEDGTLLVTGIASSPNQDSQKETVTAAAMKAAIPEYMKFANVREMHDSKKAAGVAIELDVGADDLAVMTAHIVDPIAVSKVLTGVYKGFSIGGKVTSRDKLDKSIIHGIELYEISLVDRPANPDAVFTCYKVDGITDEEEVSADPDPAVDPAVKAADPDAISVTTDGPPSPLEQEPAVDVPVTVKGNLPDGTEIELRKTADGKWEQVPDDVLKGSYSIARLAELAEGLEYFASSQQYDVGSGASSIPESARKAAGQLYDMLLTLVGEDVAAAKTRMKASKKSVSTDDAGGDFLRKHALSADDLVVFEDDVLGKFAGSADGIAKLKELISDSADLAKKYNDLFSKWSAQPVPHKADAVLKSADTGGDEPAAEVPVDPLSLVKSVHAAGGRRIGGAAG